MPYLKISTNQAINKSTLGRASRLLAELLGKPEAYVLVEAQHNPQMLFAGNDAPLAYLELKSIGLPASATASLSAAMCTLMQEELGIREDRVYIEFADAPRHMWGWNGATF